MYSLPSETTDCFLTETPVLLQVKKLQVMLRQANDQLERTMTEKQNLEDSVKAGNEEIAVKVCAQIIYPEL